MDQPTQPQQPPETTPTTHSPAPAAPPGPPDNTAGPDLVDPSLPPQPPLTPQNEILTGELLDDLDEAIPHDKLPKFPAVLKVSRRNLSMQEITAADVENFLQHIELTGLFKQSCDATGIDYFTITRLRKEDSDFAQYYDESMQVFRESLEQECHRRAVVGWDEPVFSQRLGTEMGTIRRHDPRLLELMLKRHIPEYREKFEGEIKVSGGVLVAPISQVTVDAWAAQHGGERIKLLSEEAPHKVD